MLQSTNPWKKLDGEDDLNPSQLSLGLDPNPSL